MNPTIIQLQDRIAQEVVDAAAGDWQRIVLNFEITFGADAMTGQIFFSVVKDASGNLVIDNDIRFPFKTSRLMRELNDAIFAQTGTHWGICDLVIDSTGTYDFKYDYGPAKRLNEVRDESSSGRFKNYLEHYRAEQTSKQSTLP